ncbi:MAG: DUF4097 family beta strand repeat protein [Colwellia sp.]|nr:DUF4097 family beta strand repeat protein [Colwellia sp.]
MKLSTSLIAIATITLLSGCVVVMSSSYANFHTQKTLTLEVSQLSTLVIDAGSGSLEVRGQADIDEIRVIADIYTDKKYKNNYQLSLTDSKDKAYLTAKINNSSGFWQGRSPYIDVQVIVPQRMMLDINDSSGDLLLSNIHAHIELIDGSGGIDITHVIGNLTLNDGSGELNIAHIRGDVTIKDGSGDMQLDDIQGNVNINDGSGSIHAQNITGTAVLEDGSGDMMVRNVEGMVTIEDGSGDIDVQSVGGLKLLETGSGGLRVKSVKGYFEVDG